MNKKRKKEARYFEENLVCGIRYTSRATRKRGALETVNGKSATGTLRLTTNMV